MSPSRRSDPDSGTEGASTQRAPSRRALYFVSLLIDLVYLILLPFVALPFLFYLLVVRRRRLGGLRDRFGGVRVPALPSDRTRVWFHTVSVGEFEAAWPLLDRLRSERPDLDLVVSSTTATGHEVAVRRMGAERVFYFPLDFGYCMRRTLRRVSPGLMVLVELEIWPNHLLSCAIREVPVLVVNGRVSARGFRRMNRFRGFFGPLFRTVRLLSAQSDEYAERMIALGASPDRVVVDGNLKFDREAPAEDSGVARTRFVEHRGGQADAVRYWIAGSTHPGEEAAVLRVHAQLTRRDPQLRLILAPRHIERSAVVLREVEAAGFSVAPLREARAAEVVLVDEMGQLATLYGVAEVAFVGGSLVPIGGHNILEPVTAGTPVAHGPHMHNFRQEVQLLGTAGATQQVESEEELVEVLGKWLEDPSECERRRRLGSKLIAEQRGAVDRAVKRIASVLSSGGATL